MSEIKNIPRLRFSEFHDNWGLKTLGELGDIINGITYSPTQIQDRGVLVLRSSNIQNGRLSFEDNVYISVEKYNPVKKNDILICVRNGSQRLIGKSALISKSFYNMGFGAFMTVYRSERNPFLYHWFDTEKYYKEVHKNLGATINSINGSDLKKFKVPFPSLPEQQKIADFLTAVDKRIELLEKKKTLLETYKKGVMKKIFNQEIRFKDDNGNDFPDWEEKRLDEILEERNQQSPKSDNYPLMAFSAEKGISHKGERYNREFLVKDIDNKKYKKTEFGDFIYSSNNLETGSIGLNTHGPASISPVYSIFKTKKKFDFNFLGRYLVRKEFIYKMTRYRQGVMYGQWRIHESDFLKINDRFPCFDEQKVIGIFLLSIDSYINEISIVIDKTKTWKKGLLQKMFV